MLDQKLTPRTISELVQATGLLYRELAGLEPDAVKPFFARHAEINDPERMASRQAIWVRSDSDRKDFGLLRDLYRTVYDAFQSANSRANRHAATLPLLPAMLDTRRAVLYDSGRSKMGLALPIFRYSPVMMRFLERVGMPGTCFFDPDHDTAAVRNLGQRSDNTIAGKTAYTERPSDLRWVVMESMYKLDEERRALDLPIEAFEVFAPMSYMSSQGTVVATPFGSLSQHILRQLTDMK